MLKLITQLIILSFCLSLNAQSTPDVEYPSYLKNQSDKKNISVTNARILNSVYHDYSPLIVNNGILFTSDRVEGAAENNADANFYFSFFNESMFPARPKLYDSELNSNFQEGMATVSPDGKTLIFSRDAKEEEKTKGFSDVRLYMASWDGNEWTDIEMMSINMDTYSSGHPAFSPEGDKLYFVSNRPGGFGATDIYVSEMKKGKWSKPKNLGSKINSSKSELFPFVDETGLLYFSSNRKGGSGLLDIYASVPKKLNKWSAPLNMGEPFNTASNDFGIYVAKDGRSGYLSSNRPESLGGNDIFKWTSLVEEEMVVSENKIERNCIKVEGQLLDDKGNDIKKENVRVMITNLVVKGDREIYTDENGSFSACLDCESDFSISAYPEDYYLDNIIVSTKEIACSDAEVLEVVLQLTGLSNNEELASSGNMNSLNTDSELTGKELEERNAKNKAMLESISIAEEEEDFEEEPDASLEEVKVEKAEEEKVEENMLLVDEEREEEKFSIIPNIYYDFNSHDIPEKDKTYLNDLGDYLKSNPDYGISITSYTDSKGKKAYNKWLSKRRAEKVMEYLITAGVDKTKINAAGKGESEVERYDESDTNASNSRRTEFELIENFGTVENTILETEDLYVSSIYYDFNAHQLNQNSTVEVEKLIDRLRNDPSLKVEIRSHTDSRGSETYNQWLSQKRANEVVRYIVSQGIGKDRLQAKGFGESQLVNDCADGTRCSKSEHLQNRRTEFVFD